MPRTILVTGASRGIGRATALHLASQEGASLLLLGRDAAALDETARLAAAGGGTARILVADITDRASLSRALEGVGRLDGLVHAAAEAEECPFGAAEADAAWDATLGSGLTGAWNVLRAALPTLGQGSRVVLVASVLGRFGVPGMTAYCAAKHGLLGLTRALALELLPRGIVVNAVAPGWVDTEMAAGRMEQMARAMGVEPAEARRRAERQVPMKRFFQPLEIARGIAWMLSPENTTQVGQCLNLDGGVVQD